MPDAFLVKVENLLEKTVANNVFDFTVEGIPPQTIPTEVRISICSFWQAPPNGFNQELCSATQMPIPAKVPVGEEPTPTKKVFLAPTITHLQAFPKTIKSSCTIVISWVGPQQYDVFEINSANGSATQRYSQDISGTASSSTYHIPGLHHRTRYDLAVRGIFKQWEDWPWEKKNFSPWSATQTIVTASPHTSLRAFLQGTDASQGIRRLIPKNVTSLRSFRSF